MSKSLDRPLLVYLPSGNAELVKPVRFDAACPGGSTDADLLVIRNGVSRCRSEERYWRFGPGFSAEPGALAASTFS